MRRICLSVFLSCFHLLAAPPGARAQAAQQSPPRHDETVVVTADREAELIGNTGSAVTVIRGEEIAASGARWLIDVLQFAPGVSVTRTGPPGTLTEIYLRGAGSGHTLFLIDGVKVNSPTSGSFDLANLQVSADQIDRIEIVRGPQSTLYGSQAIGGVVNVITRRGEGAGTWGVEADGGSYGTGRLHSWANGQLAALRYTGAISYYGNAEADGYDNVSYNGRVDWEAGGGMRVRGFLRGFDGEVEFDGFSFTDGPIDAPRNVQDTRELYAGGAVGYGGERFSTDLELSLSDVASDSLTPDDFFTGFFLDSAIYEVDWHNDFVLPAAQQLTAGLEYRREQATIRSVSGIGTDSYDEAVDVVGVYLQDRVTPAEWLHLAAGARYEEHSTFGNQLTGRLTASIDAAGPLRVHGSVGSAFKAPTLNDLYFPGFSNPDLQPEESVGFDLGVEVAARDARAGMTYFHSDITNLIQFDAAAGVPANFGEVLARGVELDGGVVLSASLNLAGNYTFTSSIPDGTGEQLIRRPRHQGGARLSWRPLADLRTWAELRFEAGRFDSGASGRVELDAFAIVNLAADYRLARRFLLRGRVDNLFDTDYQEVVGFGTAGVSGYLGLTFTLSR
jgi:vitamin B12 transporter